MTPDYDNRMLSAPMGRANDLDKHCDPYGDIGPTVPAQRSVYSKARKVREEVQIAMELSMDGPRCDVPRAVQHLDRARAILGER
jgi:hypothetical protein